MFNPEQIIKHLHLKPLPIEGGYFIQSYRAAETIAGSALPVRYSNIPHLFGGAIYYLLTDHPDSFSALHRLKTDELYHFYLGDPVRLTLLQPDGAVRHVALGQDLYAGQHVQFNAPRDIWQGSRLVPGGKFALLGTTMAPAFEPADYTHGERATLIHDYPGHKMMIETLTRAPSGEPTG